MKGLEWGFELTTYALLSMFLAASLSPLIISLLYKLKIFRLASFDYSTIVEKRNMKVGTPIMGGLIFVIPIILLSLLSSFDFNTFTFIGGTVKITALVFGISSLLGGLDDVLNIYGRERPVRSLRRTFKLAFVHKSILYRLYLFVTLPWTAYKTFFYMLGSNPGKGIQAHEKVLVQIVVGIMMVYWIYVRLGWSHIWFPLLGNIEVGLLIVPFIILTIITMTNAVNISDGLDGLSSGLALIAFVGFLITALLVGNKPVAIICALTIGALLPYLYFNTPPARIQMGDVGSLALGTLLASIAFSLNRPFLLLFFGGIFVIELLSSLIQGVGRRVLGRRIFKMAPLHHHFEMLGWSEEKITIRFWVFGMILSLFGLLIAFI
jgi:phospho-N-acetylmuramoyl-pentapeptide-transferase